MPSNRELTQSIYDAFAKGDPGPLFGAMHPECNWKEAENHPLADQNPYIGAERIGAGVFGRLMPDFDGFTVTTNQLVAEGDQVIGLGRYTGTHKHAGKRLDAQFAHAWTFRDGQGLPAVHRHGAVPAGGEGLIFLPAPTARRDLWRRACQGIIDSMRPTRGSPLPASTCA